MTQTTTGSRDSERPWMQLTEGAAAHYPLYYFVPSHTDDGRYMAVHELRDGEVQLQRLELATGELVTFTDGTTRHGGWDIWCQGAFTGIYNHLSALNQVTSELYWFQDHSDPNVQCLQVCACHLDTLATRLVLELPGRTPIGQSAFSPDGSSFAFIHADAIGYANALETRDTVWKDHETWRKRTPCTIGLIDTRDGSYRDVIALDFHVHHLIFADNDHLLVNHQRTGNGMWSIDIDGTPASIRTLREQTAHGRVCHQLVTQKGIFYEVFSSFTGNHETWVGHHEWPGDAWSEVKLPTEGYAHTGFDPVGDVLVYEVSGKPHGLYALLRPHSADPELRLLRELPPYPGHGQIYHAHPFLGPDRQWLYYTEAIDGIPQICAIDISDLVANPDCRWRVGPQ